MDIHAIHDALVAVWPNEIPRESYALLAGIFKVCAEANAAPECPSHDTQIMKSMLDMNRGSVSRKGIATSQIDQYRPTTPVSKETLARVMAALATGSRTREDIARQIQRGARCTRAALSILRERGIVVRISIDQGPHLYKLK